MESNKEALLLLFTFINGYLSKRNNAQRIFTLFDHVNSCFYQLIHHESISLLVFCFVVSARFYQFTLYFISFFSEFISGFTHIIILFMNLLWLIVRHTIYLIYDDKISGGSWFLKATGFWKKFWWNFRSYIQIENEHVSEAELVLKMTSFIPISVVCTKKCVKIFPWVVLY